MEGPREGSKPSPGSNQSSRSLMSEFEPSARRENKFLLFKPHSLRSLVRCSSYRPIYCLTFGPRLIRPYSFLFFFKSLKWDFLFYSNRVVKKPTVITKYNVMLVKQVYFS